MRGWGAVGLVGSRRWYAKSAIWLTFPSGECVPAAPVRFRGHPSNQPLLFRNGRQRKSRTQGKTIYKGCNLGARLFGLSRTGFFI
jgi:hypothetical protein